MSSPKNLTHKLLVVLVIFLIVGCQIDEDVTLSAFSKPSTPQILSVRDITENSLIVEWNNASEEEAVNKYVVYQDDVQVAIDSTNSYEATGLNPESEYRFSVRAVNVADKISDFSPEVSVKTEKEDDAREEAEVDRVLVFSKTEAFRHTSIEKGLATLVTLGAENNFVVAHTEEASDFTSENLSTYKTVVFLSTTGDVLNVDQQSAFEKYIQAGGSYMGVHAATDTEYEWPWYGQLVGAYFNGHPDIQEANITVVDKTHQATQHLEDTWKRTDEWYNFKDINSNIHVLMTLDESSYEGGTNGENHPAAWYHQYDGGRSFYTAGGHSDEAFDEPDFKTHLLGGLLYCLQR